MSCVSAAFVTGCSGDPIKVAEFPGEVLTGSSIEGRLEIVNECLVIKDSTNTTLLAASEGTAVTSAESLEVAGATYRIGESYAFAGRISADLERDAVSAESDCLELANGRVWLLHTP